MQTLLFKHSSQLDWPNWLVKLTPEVAEFEDIYRAATQVYEDKEGRFLYAPKPTEYTYIE